MVLLIAPFSSLVRWQPRSRDKINDGGRDDQCSRLNRITHTQPDTVYRVRLRFSREPMPYTDIQAYLFGGTR